MPSFDEVVDQVRVLLQSKGRVVYRTLKRRFDEGRSTTLFDWAYSDRCGAS